MWDIFQICFQLTGKQTEIKLCTRDVCSRGRVNDMKLIIGVSTVVEQAALSSKIKVLMLTLMMSLSPGTYTLV